MSEQIVNPPAPSVHDFKALADHLANTPKILFGSATVTTTANGNFDLSLSASQYNILAIHVTSPGDVMVIPCLYSSYGGGVLGGHAMSILASQTVVANTQLSVLYAYVKRSTT